MTADTTTDPDARLAREGGEASRLAYHAHVLLDNRHGLVRNVCATHATGTAGVDAALLMVEATLRRGAIDGRTTRHAGYAISQRKRKLVEQAFGWMKTIAGLRQVRHRGGRLVEWQVTFAAAACNLVRLRTLTARAA